jgi:hypothetical protein
MGENLRACRDGKMNGFCTVFMSRSVIDPWVG